MTVPKISSINDYGSGVLVDAVPLVDPTSEMGADALNPLRNDVAGMTATAPKLLFQYKGSSSGNPTVQISSTWTAGHDAMWGNAPAVIPLLTRVGTGHYTVQLPAEVDDQIGGSNLVNIRAVRVSMIDDSGGAPAACIATVTSASTFRIKQFIASSGSASDFNNIMFLVEVY